MTSDPTLEELRHVIDQVDREILALVARRVTLVCKIAEVKRSQGMAAYDPERERSMLRKLSERSVAPLDGETVRRIFERLIDECRRIEQQHMTELT